MRAAQASQIADGLQRDISKIERQIEQLLDRIVDAGNASVVSAYEKRIEKLEREQRIAAERLAKRADRRIPLRSCSNSP